VYYVEREIRTANVAMTSEREDPKPLPSDDVDAKLARRLDSEAPFSATDSFEHVLVDYRTHALDTSPRVGLSSRLWANIARQVFDRREPRITRIRMRWVAVAATVLIAVIGSWLFIGRGPALVSEATNAIAQVELKDGSVVTLRPNTSLYESDGGYRVDGEAFFNVAHKPDRTFRVRTDQGEVRVLGTRFNVRAWAGQTVVFLERGRVVFQHSDGAVDTLASGQVLAASADAHEVRQATEGGQVHVAWMRQTMLFGGRPLSGILEELEHHFAIRVVVPDSLNSEELSGQLFLSNPDQSLSDLGKVFGARFEERGRGVFYFMLD
jgi:transmembrane sensor